MKNYISFVDLLFNALMGFFVLLLISLMLINDPVKKKKDIENKSQVMVTIEWPDNSKDDVDVFMLSPTDEILYYGRKDIKAASLDRDDRGKKHDLVVINGERKEIKGNWEHIFIRKLIDGEYIINVLMYQKLDPQPTEVKFKIEKFNPYELIYSGKVTLSDFKEEQTIIRFSVRDGKEILNVNNDYEGLVSRVRR